MGHHSPLDSHIERPPEDPPDVFDRAWRQVRCRLLRKERLHVLGLEGSKPMLDLSDDLFLKSRVGSADGVGGPE